MKVFSFDNNSWPKIDEEIALCLGYFDGVHLGHLKLVSEAKKLCKKVGILTLDKSPAEIFNKYAEVLTDREGKIAQFEKAGVDYYFELKMNEKLINDSKSDFINNIINNINPKFAVCGSDYSFGKNKEGNVKYLSSRIDTKIVDFERMNKGKISSTKIKEMIQNGDVLNVHKYLGRDYSVFGTVVKGLDNGKKIHFPTANLQYKSNYVSPQDGVYYGITKIDGKSYKSLGTFGTHPTISELDHPILEVHILDFNKDIYGKEVEFEFIRFIRKNRKFETIELLEKQIEKDKESIASVSEWKIIVVIGVCLILMLFSFALIGFLL